MPLNWARSALRLNALSANSPTPFGTTLRSIALEVHEGEVLGIGGVAGNGQDELLAALSGELLTEGEAIEMGTEPVGHLGPNARRKLGILAAPEERLGHAAAPDMTLTENAVLTGTVRKELANRGFVDWTKAKSIRRGSHRRIRRQNPGTGKCCAVAVGGQPAEIRHRSRSETGSKGSRRQSTDLGRGCVRRGVDPAVAA